MKFLSISLLTILSFSSWSQNTDLDLLMSINGSYTKNGGTAMTIVSESVTPVAFGVPATMFAVGWINHNKDLQWKSTEIFASQLTNTIIVTSMKLGFKRERPYDTYPDQITKYGHGGSYSFPSGHTSTAFAFATSMSINYPKWYIIVPCYTYASAVGYSRMYLGVHYPSDVLVGALIGSASAVGTHYLFKFIRRKTERNKVVAPI
ncbi:MAG: phosphatase PAP2 family protein [Fluviicola sp.]|nr:phosphatase PAP2 family protein [Fluviicola sp.]